MAWEKAQALFERIRHRFKDDEEIESAVTLISKQPESETRQAMLGEILAARLESDPALSQELAALIAELSAQGLGGIVVSGSGAVATHGGVATGVGGIAASGDVRIDIGDNNLPEDPIIGPD